MDVSEHLEGIISLVRKISYQQLKQYTMNLGHSEKEAEKLIFKACDLHLDRAMQALEAREELYRQRHGMN
jgi:hypothetical protein